MVYYLHAVCYYSVPLYVMVSVRGYLLARGPSTPSYALCVGVHLVMK